MRVKVKAFGSLYQWLPDDENKAYIELPDDAKVEDLITSLRIPKKEVWFAVVNGERAQDDQALSEGDEVSLYSPVGGG